MYDLFVEDKKKNNSRSNCQYHWHASWFRFYNCDWKIKVKQTLCSLDAKIIWSQLCCKQEWSFQWTISISDIKILSISLKNCNRKWNVPLSVPSWRQSTIKEMTKMCKRSSKNESSVKSKHHKNSFVMLRTFCLLPLWKIKTQ